MKTNILSLTCIICLLCCLSLFLTSCQPQQTHGIVDAEINASGELILTYQDGSEQNLGVVVGKDGADGSNGADGKDGNNGKDGDLVIEGYENGFATASAKGLRSAVSIVCNFQANVQMGGWRPGYGSTTTKDYSSAGSGVIYQLDNNEGDAFIITNYHVVYDSSSNTSNGISNDINIYLYGSSSKENAIKGTYVGGSVYYDIAVLRVEDNEILKNSNACQIDISNSDKVAVGDSAIAIGNAKGYGISVSSGIVSVDSEYITMTSADGRNEVSFRVMRVDTAVNSGNSGGGLFDGQGNLIGIVNAKIVDDGVENIGYAIPSNVAISIADNIIDYCFETDMEHVQRALIGITVDTSDSKAVYDTESGQISIHETVFVYDVSDGSLADGILQKGDVLIAATVNGVKAEISRQYHAIDMMLDVRAGDLVVFDILRDGETCTVQISITEDCLTAY